VNPRLVITNAAAGSSDDASIEAALGVLRDDGPVRVEATVDAEELGRVLAGRRDDETVVAIGGDGSLHALVSALHARGELPGVPIGLIPLGTGNDFARTIGLSDEPDEAARQLVAAVRTPLDLILDDEDQVTVNAVHIGLGADAGRLASRWKRWLGPLGYVVGAIQAGLTAPGLHLRIYVDQERLPHSHGVTMVAMGNGAYVGAGAELTPDADPGDGWADVMVSYADAPLARLGYALRLRRGDHALREDVKTHKVRELAVQGDQFWVNSDGEVSGPYRERRWRVVPGAVVMMLPGTGGYNQPRLTASTPAWKRESTPRSAIRAAIRRRTVRSDTPSARAICSSIAPPASSASS